MWAIKDSSITRTFFDEGAATFFLPHLASQPTEEQQTASNSSDDIVEVSPLKRTKYAVESHSRTGNGNGEDTMSGMGMGMGTGGALGPDWHSELKMIGKAFDEVSTFQLSMMFHLLPLTVLALQKYRHIHVEYQCEVARLLTQEEFKTSGLTISTFPSHHNKTADDRSSTDSSEQMDRHPQASPTPEKTLEWPVYVQLTNGKTYGCDLVVSATGVVPNSDVVRIKCDHEKKEVGLKVCVEDGGGIEVDSGMRTSLGDIYAAGDVCTVQWKEEQAALWFQVSRELRYMYYQFTKFNF